MIEWIAKINRTGFKWVAGSKNRMGIEKIKGIRYRPATRREKMNFTPGRYFSANASIK